MSDNRCESKFQGSRCAKFPGHEGEHHDPGAGQRWRSMRDIEPPTVPASEHQRVQAERDEARAQAAAMRRALEEYDAKLRDVWGKEDDPYAVAYGWSEIKREAALSSSAGAALLEEVEGLRREVERLKESERAANEMAADRLADAHGDGQESALDDALRALGLEPGGDGFAKLADLRARLERAEKRRFPIQGGPSIPWAMIAPHEAQAQANHSQSLERLAERGGLSQREACAVLEGLTLHDMMGMSPTIAPARLAAHVAAWEGRSSETVAAEVRRAVEEERERIATLLRARASEWGADTAVGHALEVAGAAIRARGKGPEK